LISDDFKVILESETLPKRSKVPLEPKDVFADKYFNIRYEQVEEYLLNYNSNFKQRLYKLFEKHADNKDLSKYKGITEIKEIITKAQMEKEKYAK